MAPKVSILTPTVRIDGLNVVKESIENQTFKSFEWLICSPTDPGISFAKWIPDRFSGGFWSLNRAYSTLVKHSLGSVLVSLQDWISVPPNGIAKFVTAVEKTDGVVTGVGDQYESIDEMGIPQVKIWSDPRKRLDQGSFYEVNFTDIEYNWAAMSRDLWNSSGGVDEELDFLGYGGDLFQLSDRLNDLGKHFWIDQSNESFTIRHDRSVYGGEDNWNHNHIILNGLYDRRKMTLKRSGQWPVLSVNK